MENINKDKLIGDVKAVIADAEDLFKAAANSTGEKATELRELALNNLVKAKEKLQDVHEIVREKSKVAAQATDDYVHEHPWKTAGAAVAIGFFLGLLVNRR